MTNNILSDESQRLRAIDSNQSFIVHAPAGSGKTSLLIQRFLALLIVVEKYPEEILAITFTRKAAAEMRHRIIAALRDASTLPAPEEIHAKRTWQLAKKVLSRDKKAAWHLLENPARLRIQTIDALCANLTYQMPLVSKFGAQPAITEQAEVLYREVVQCLIEQLDEKTPWAKAAMQLLLHLDNRVNVFEDLLVNMLAKRDQWLPHIIKASNQKALRQSLERGLLAITEDALEKMHQVMPRQYMDEIIQLAEFSAAMQSQHIDFSLLNDVDGCLDEVKNVWLFVSDLLLTTVGEFRQTVTIKQGFPAEKVSSNKAEKVFYIEMKNRMKSLLTALTDFSAFKSALFELKKMPPTRYNDSQWQAVQALLTLLPIAAAQLKLVFQKYNQVDFIEIAQAALTALGDEDNPTDLALTLDYQIRHLLVDEFQDTSITQFHLIKKITREWLPGDGRTLFLVGDPMQSIYRFRDAEVGLFLRTCREGIGNIALPALYLQTNFRAEKTILDWINTVFAKVFPLTEDISAGAVSYYPSQAIHQNDSRANVHWHALVNPDDVSEAQKIVEVIRRHHAQCPEDTVAILVKARSHLTEILPALRQAQLAYQAVEIDSLKTCSVIQDLLALTKALLHLGDRIAWLSILRAPWCGLTLNDLLVVANTQADETIWDKIKRASDFHQLSDEGEKRLTYLRSIIENVFKQKCVKSLRQWIYQAFLALRGPAYYDREEDLENATVYFELLEAIATGEDIKHFDQLEMRIDQLFAKPNVAASDRLQVMTIHKAKGLEFDVVIIPGLERASVTPEAQMLRWLERPRTHQTDDLILAPIKAFREERDEIYQYLSYEDAIKSEWEAIRLFYVAVTRAKKMLHLVGSVYRDTKTEVIKPPKPRSFLRHIWVNVESDFLCEMKQSTAKSKSDASTKQVKNFLKRFPINEMSAEIVVTDSKILESSSLDITLDFNRHESQCIGTVIHKIFEQIAKEGLSAWQPARLKTVKDYWKSLLMQSGVLPTNVDKAIQQVELAVNNILSDERGRWILRAHPQAESELAIASVIEGEVKRFVIDRTFVDDGVRWVIDYKTSMPDKHESLETFLEKEKLTYELQLAQYTKLIAELYSEQTVRIGLYFSMIPVFISWENDSRGLS